MATLKDHQQAMVDLLASGSGIPASASRLAHAMHDVLHIMAEQLKEDVMQQSRDFAAEWGAKHVSRCAEAITPGLNDKALSKREKALKTDSPAKWPTPAEQRVKELENTIRQLKANLVRERACVAELRNFLNEATVEIAELKHPQSAPEQAGCHKSVPFASVKSCDHRRHQISETFMECLSCGADLSHELRAEQAGCRKEDTQVCEHDWVNMPGFWAGDNHPLNQSGHLLCCKCGAKQ